MSRSHAVVRGTEPLRLRLVIDPLLTLPSELEKHGRRFMMSLPAGHQRVADLVRHLSSRFPSVAWPALVLTIDGFMVPFDEALSDVVREGDVIVVGDASKGFSQLEPAASCSQQSQPQQLQQLLDQAPPPAKRPRVSQVALGDVAPAEAESSGVAASRSSRKAVEAAPVEATPRKKPPAVVLETTPVEATPRRKPPAAVVLETPPVESTPRRKAPAATLETAPVEEGSAVSDLLPARPVPAPARKADASSTMLLSAVLGSLREADADGSDVAASGDGTTFVHPLLGALEVQPGEDRDALVNRKLKTMKKAIRRQVEHYFSAANWAKDEYLRAAADAAGFVDLGVVADFDRVKTLTTDVAFIGESVRDSPVVEVSPCASRIRPRAV